MKNVFKLIVKNLKEYVPLNIFRGGQETVYVAIRDAIIKGIRTMYIEGPTGMGKSFIQSTLADAIINGTDIQILLLVPKITLLTQMQREFTKFAKHLILGLVGDGHKSYHNQITVMTYQSFVGISNDILKKYSVIFLDEVHKAMGEKTQLRINEQKHAIIIGFTATPTYDEERNLKDFLGHEAYRISIPEAVKEGMLSAIQFIIGKVRIEIFGKQSDETQSDYTERMGKDIIRQGGNIAAVKLYKKIFEKRGTRFIMFTVSVKQGEDLVDELRSNGIAAELITGKMKTRDRDELFIRFASNQFKKVSMMQEFTACYMHTQ
jgi:superfamily II DNA or RNA helicase